jgi:hypothetical protein
MIITRHGVNFLDPDQKRKCFFSRSIQESVDLIAFLFDVEANGKFYCRHIVDIPRIKFSI